jgi:hypothetical protein
MLAILTLGISRATAIKHLFTSAVLLILLVTGVVAQNTTDGATRPVSMSTTIRVVHTWKRARCLIHPGARQIHINSSTRSADPNVLSFKLQWYRANFRWL